MTRRAIHPVPCGKNRFEGQSLDPPASLAELAERHEGNACLSAPSSNGAIFRLRMTPRPPRAASKAGRRPWPYWQLGPQKGREPCRARVYTHVIQSGDGEPENKKNY